MKILKILVLIVFLITTVFGCKKSDDSQQILSDLLSHKSINHFRFVSKDIIEKNRQESDQSLSVEYDVTLSTESVTIIAVSTLKYNKDAGKLVLQQNDLVINQILPTKGADIETARNYLNNQQGTTSLKDSRIGRVRVLMPKNLDGELTKISETEYEIVLSESYEDDLFKYKYTYHISASFDLVRGWEYVFNRYDIYERMDWNGTYEIVFDLLKPEDFDYDNSEYAYNEVIRLTIQGISELNLSVLISKPGVYDTVINDFSNDVFVSYNRKGQAYRLKSQIEFGTLFFTSDYPNPLKIHVQDKPDSGNSLYLKYGKIHQGSDIGFSAYGVYFNSPEYDLPASMNKIAE
jgi:hypothetical protein